MSDLSGKWKGTLLEGSAKFPYSLYLHQAVPSLVNLKLEKVHIMQLWTSLVRYQIMYFH